MKILFLLPYPLNRAPSQRFRVEMLLPILNDNNIGYELKPFLTDRTYNVLYKNGSLLKKMTGMLKSYCKRALTVFFEAHKYDHIFIHREAAPFGPPVFEWYLAKILRKPIVYDFDDAIWIPNTSVQNRIANAVKAFWKVAYICKWSKSISAGNDYLCQFAKKNSSANVVKMPTVVDTVNRYNQQKEHHNGKITVGWTGSHSTLKYLDAIVPMLQKLQREIDFTFLVIADHKPELPLSNFEYRPWNAATEIEDLLRIDIGLMPLTEDLWTQGKCGFKLIQYLALGIPAISAPVGVNKDIVEHGINGFICLTPEDWYNSLKELVTNIDLRKQFGKHGRDKIELSYSIAANRNKFLELFK